jgi:hypothetical protein
MLDRYPPGGIPDPFVVTSLSKQCQGNVLMAFSAASTFGSGVWPQANLAQFFPFTITARHTYVRALLCNGATVNGNFDIGVYDLDGDRLFSTGSTAQAGVTQTQGVNISWTLDPGIYHLALAMSSATATVARSQPDNLDLRLNGCKQMASAIPLPDPAVFAACAFKVYPLFGISEKSWV